MLSVVLFIFFNANHVVVGQVGIPLPLVDGFRLKAPGTFNGLIYKFSAIWYSRWLSNTICRSTLQRKIRSAAQ